MKSLQIILITLTSLLGCTKKAGTVPVATNKPISAMLATDTMSYLALGDSYTIGEAVPQDQSYPYQLTNSLNNYSFKVKVPTIIAITGWTTDDLINAISRSAFQRKEYDFVTLLIGVNDQFQQLSQANYSIKFAQVLRTAIKFAKGDTSKVFVLSIPDYGVTPFAGGNDGIIGPQIDQFNAINKELSQKAGVNYLDITTISRMAVNDPALIASDGLHPSGKMYAMWVSLLEPLVAKQLRK